MKQIVNVFQFKLVNQKYYSIGKSSITESHNLSWIYKGVKVNNNRLNKINIQFSHEKD